MQNNDCIHKFSDWKKLKKPVIDCESMSEDARALTGICFQRKCTKCGYVDTKFEPIKKGGKHLSLKMNGSN